MLFAPAGSIVMAKDLVTVRSFTTAEEAHAFKNMLEAAGIPAFVEDAALAGWMWHYGIAVGGIKVQVAEEDVGRAAEMLQEEPVSIQELDAEALSTPPDSSEECVEENRVAGLEETEPAPADSPGDRMAIRALLAALLGIGFCPFLLHLYSLYVLLRLRFSSYEVSPKKRWMLPVAFIIDALMIGFVLLFFPWSLLAYGRRHW
jgi:putative signal transducing protein